MIICKMEDVSQVKICQVFFLQCIYIEGQQRSLISMHDPLRIFGGWWKSGQNCLRNIQMRCATPILFAALSCKQVQAGWLSDIPHTRNLWQIVLCLLILDD